MVDWLAVDSKRVRQIGYLAQSERILVEFPDGIRWWYGECPAHIWEEFSSPATSKGQYIHVVLDGHPNGRYDG